MRRNVLAGALWGAIVFGLLSVPANAQEFSGKFAGFNEVPAILSEGQGTIKLKLDKSLGTITYELTYSGLSSDVTQSHIHFGRVHTAGSIMVFFCTNLGNGPAGTPACPVAGGTVTGTITAASVVAVPSQNIKAGDFDAITDALFSHTAYANVHSKNFPGGEIRAEVRQDRHEDEDDKDR